MNITGEALIGGIAEKGSGNSFLAFDPAKMLSMAPAFYTVERQQIDTACSLAQAAFDPFRACTGEQRAVFLEAIAQQIMALGDRLIERAMAETGLLRGRLESERGRTISQLQLFADLLREGSWPDIRIDSALPDRQPPRPDLRMQLIGLGPVAVFAASNFPLAFSVAGGDTAAAFAAGCPVVLKVHPAHPGTSELVGRAIVKAVQLCGLPAGVFSLLTGTGNEIGQELVRHPAIQAVGFTGSRFGGLALMAVAAARPQPIPVYAEMSSINPLFLFPQALAQRAEEIAKDFVTSLTLGAGQFCTNPGLVLAVDGPDLDRFVKLATQIISGVSPAPMLTPGIAANYQRGVEALTEAKEVSALIKVNVEEGKGNPAMFVTTADTFLNQHALQNEVFGPTSLLVVCRDADQMRAVTEGLEGQLTATIQIEEADFDHASALLPVLERKVGRILANGFPTGVEVATAMVHGGPYPATSDGRSTSVGTAAIHRFLRPVCYQNLPQALLPESLRDENAGNIWRRHDGLLGKK